MKTTIPLCVFMEYKYKPDYSGKHWIPGIWDIRVADDTERIFVGETSIEVETPDDFNPIPTQVACLEKEKTAAVAEYQKKVAEINERLSKLLAITNEAV